MSIGPLVRKELVAVSRRRRTFWMRAGALGLLAMLMVPLLILLLMHSDRSYNSRQGAAEFLFQAFVWTQFALLVMSAPAFSAGAISTERRLGTIDLLKLAAVRAPTLTLGKFLGAAGLPALLVLSEVPFLFVWTLFGGLPPESILATLLLSAAVTVLFIAIGLFTSAVSDTAGIAMVVSYAVSLLYLTAQWWAAPLLPAGSGAWLVQTALWHQLNDTTLASYPWWKAAAAAVGASLVLAAAASLFLVQAPSVSRLLDTTRVGSRVVRRSRPVWNHPVLWREIYCGGGRKVSTFLNVATVLSLGCLAAGILIDDSHLRNVVGGVIVGLPAVTGGVLGAISVSLEKEGHSVAALLLTPASSSSVVLGKFAGSCLRALPLTVVPFLLGFVRMEPLWMWSSLTSALLSLLLVSLGTLSSVIFAKTAASVAATFGGLVMLSFCCCSNTMMMGPFMLMGLGGQRTGEGFAMLMIFGIWTAIYGVMIATILAIAVGMFEGRAREAA